MGCLAIDHISFVVFHPLTSFEVKTRTFFEIFKTNPRNSKKINYAKFKNEPKKRPDRYRKISNPPQHPVKWRSPSSSFWVVLLPSLPLWWCCFLPPLVGWCCLPFLPFWVVLFSLPPPFGRCCFLPLPCGWCLCPNGVAPHSSVFFGGGAFPPSPLMCGAAFPTSSFLRSAAFTVSACVWCLSAKKPMEQH